MSYDALSSGSQSQKVGQSFLKSIFESGQVMTFKRKCHNFFFFCQNRLHCPISSNSKNFLIWICSYWTSKQTEGWTNLSW